VLDEAAASCVKEYGIPAQGVSAAAAEAGLVPHEVQHGHSATNGDWQYAVPSI